MPGLEAKEIRISSMKIAVTVTCLKPNHLLLLRYNVLSSCVLYVSCMINPLSSFRVALYQKRSDEIFWNNKFLWCLFTHLRFVLQEISVLWPDWRLAFSKNLPTQFFPFFSDYCLVLPECWGWCELYLLVWKSCITYKTSNGLITFSFTKRGNMLGMRALRGILDTIYAWIKKMTSTFNCHS